MSVVCVRMKYEDQITRTEGVAAERDDSRNMLIIRDQQGAIRGEINLDRVDSWWHEATSG
jgi:hypothetical protein